MWNKLTKRENFNAICKKYEWYREIKFGVITNQQNFISKKSINNKVEKRKTNNEYTNTET